VEKRSFPYFRGIEGVWEELNSRWKRADSKLAGIAVSKSEEHAASVGPAAKPDHPLQLRAAKPHNSIPTPVLTDNHTEVNSSSGRRIS
jgi:hypothetical protein